MLTRTMATVESMLYGYIFENRMWCGNANRGSLKLESTRKVHNLWQNLEIHIIVPLYVFKDEARVRITQMFN